MVTGSRLSSQAPSPIQVLSPMLSFQGHRTRTLWRMNTFVSTVAPKARSSATRSRAGHHQAMKTRLSTANHRACVSLPRPLSYPASVNADRSRIPPDSPCAHGVKIGATG